MQTLYRSDDLIILNVIWAPWMNLLPHNHQMWASSGFDEANALLQKR